MPPTIHGIISGSAWEKAAKCAGSIQLSARYGISESSEFTKRGDRLHDDARDWLKAKLNYERTGENEPEPCNPEVSDYTDWAWNKVIKESVTGKIIGVETRLEAHPALGRTTTADLFVLERDKKERWVLSLADLKTGHVVVEAPGNYQMAFYTVALVHELRKKGIEVNGADTYIYRLGHEDPESHYRFTNGEIKKHIALLQKRIDQAILVDQGKPVKLPFKAGEHCRYCKVRGRCTVRKEFAMPEEVHAMVPATVERKIHPPDPALMTDEQLALVCKHGPQLAKWIKDVWSYCADRERHGDHIRIGKKRALKMVAKYGKRKFVEDTSGLVKRIKREGLEDDLLDHKIKGGIGLAEKLLGKKVVAKYVVPGRESATLALWDDKRPALEALTSLLNDEPIEEEEHEYDEN